MKVLISTILLLLFITVLSYGKPMTKSVDLNQDVNFNGIKFKTQMAMSFGNTVGEDCYSM